jgi:2-oxoisovalerate dehydrogenase E1 component
MKKKNLKLQFQWQRWESEPDDMLGLPDTTGARMLFDVLTINKFEMALLELKAAGAVWGPVHTSVGQEAIAAASVAALRPTDKFATTYRAHHHFLSKAMQYRVPPTWNPAADELDAAVVEVTQKTMAEIMGLAPGYCGGRGGSMHLRYRDAGFLGSNAIVAGGVPLAAGAAYAEKFLGSGNVVMCYVGDGALHQGALHEALNLVGLWQLPMILFIENNLYAVATSVKDSSAVEDLSGRAAAYAMDGYIVDGGDPVAIYQTVKAASDLLREGGRPCVIEAKCYRRFHHAGDVPGSAFRYRSKAEEARYASKEVVVTLPRLLQKAGLLDAGQLEHIEQLAQEAVASAVTFCAKQGNDGEYEVRAELWPGHDTAAEGMRSRGSEWHGVTFSTVDQFPDTEQLRYSDAIASVTGRWLEKEPRAIVFGEEVANLGGGAYGATKGLAERFPDRVINTPISEGGFSGLAFGTAQIGMRAIVEIMFADFALVAADQLFNQISKARHMYGDTTDVPLVVRSRVGTGLGYGAQHSMDPIGLYSLFPGFRIVAPSNSFDYIGLFNSAMISEDPVAILEHNALYTAQFAAPRGQLDYCVPFGSANTVARGNDVTVLTYGQMVNRCAALLPQLQGAGVSAELIDLRTLDHLDLDFATVSESVAKTGACVIVEEAAKSQGVSGSLAEQIQMRCFDDLDGPVATCTSLDISTPVSRALELAALVSDEQIVATVSAVAKRDWG